MGNLILPQKAVIQLVDDFGEPLQIPDVIFTLHLFATHKNDFYLSPFVSDNSGKAIITREELNNEIRATYSSGLMDYASVETCHPLIEIFINQPEDIERALNAREKLWVVLLDGEKERWGSVENLINVYRQAKNNELKLSKELSRLTDDWNGEKEEYVYNLGVNKN
jgi:hypothetical protein